MVKSQEKANEIESRLVDFAVSIIKLSNKFPKTVVGMHIAGQIVRSGTSPAPNYGEARGAESKADFVHKLGIVLKELNETAIWLKIISKSEMIENVLLTGIMDENNQLARIISASIKIVRNNRMKK